MTLNMQPGLVPLPAHSVRLTTSKVEGVGMNQLGPRFLHGVCFHRAQGWGSEGWVKRPEVQGLYDWIISEKSHADMVQINKLAGTWDDLTPWAQGPYIASAASEDGKAFVRARGGNPNVVNQHLESIGIEGFYDDPISDNCKRDLSQWTASRAHDYGIEWARFPIAPNGLTFIYGHREFCGTAYKVCPGSVVWTFINGELIDRVQHILRTAQEGNKPTPVYRRPSMPTIMVSGPLPENPILNGRELTLDNRFYRVKELTGRYTSASLTSTRSGPSLRPGDDLRIVYRWANKVGDEWGLSVSAHRIPMADLELIPESEKA
jgi:hypothetical protein